MASKSDFAQKLLHDLRARKEKMAAAQSSSRQSTHTSRAAHGNTRPNSKGSRHINTLESASSRTGSGRSNNKTHTSIITNENSSQIILYKSGQKASGQKVKDLSMAIALAFENGGNLTSIRASATNPLVNFFNRFSRKSRDTHKMDLTTFGNKNHSQIPKISNIQVSEVSKGVQRLNQILRACSNGFSLEGGSIEVGKELMKGAMDLEESLRMLVNLQEASQHAENTRNKGRIKLLDEDEDDNNSKIAEKWELDRPKFSFDRPRRRQMDLLGFDETSEASSRDLGVFTQVKQTRSSSSSQPTQEKKRISNVVAKLMGLEETPLNEDFMHKKSDAKGKQGQIPKQTINKSFEPLNRESNNNTTKGHSTATTQVNGSRQIFGDNQRKQNSGIDRQSKTIKSESKMQTLNSELQQKAQNRRTKKAEHKAIDDIEYNPGASSTEMRKANEELPSNQPKHEEKRRQIQEQVLTRGERSQDKLQKVQNGQVSMITSKSKKITAVNSQRLSHDKSVAGNKRSTKAIAKPPPKDPPKRTDQDDVPMIDISQQTVTNKENIKKEDGSHKSFTREPETDVENENRNPEPMKGKAFEVSTKHKAVIPKKVQKSEIPQKIDVLMSRRQANVNHLTRSTKQPAKLLKDLKQQMHNKHRNSKRIEEQSNSEMQNEKEEMNVYSASENTNIEPEKQRDKLEKEEAKSVVLNISVEDEKQIANVQTTQCDDQTIKAGEVSNELETVEEPYALEDEQELKQSDQITRDNKGESIEELHNLPQNEDKQTPIPDRREQLTEPEKHLKEMAIKSQMFLSTAEALFKLNLPASFLHAAEQDYEAPENKLVLNCAQEVMKRKARGHGVANHPHMKPASAGPKVRSFDDLIKQLSKDLETLKLYGGNLGDERDLAARLYRMLEKDIGGGGADVNCMWDLEWSNLMALVTEKDDVVKEVERYMLNGLLDEITGDLVALTVSG
ncbi:CRM family member 2 [Striga asiatica]|uniref:CRM family member 2 n=1 Tax=Striga asiatica TaxID=4170 RepID=A0A5A7QB45_STRAF|nr:CRM family member 2 [Striga asiatica]